MVKKDIYIAKHQSLRDYIYLFSNAEIKNNKNFEYDNIGSIDSRIEDYGFRNANNYYRGKKTIFFPNKKDFSSFDVLLTIPEKIKKSYPITLNVYRTRSHIEQRKGIICIGSDKNPFYDIGQSYYNSGAIKALRNHNLKLVNSDKKIGSIKRTGLDDIIQRLNESLVYPKTDFLVKMIYYK